MKRISLLFVACLAGIAIWAQDQPPTTTTETSDEGGIRFGIKAGVNMARLRTSDFPSGFEPDVSNKTSWYGGFLVRLPLGGGGLSLQPELLYNSIGSKLETTSGSTTAKDEQTLDYISIPVMLQYKFGGGLFVETGPQASFLIKANAKASDGTEVDNKDDYEDFDFAWCAGLGYMTKMGLGINARYNYGLTNTLKNDTSTSGDNPSLKSGVISVGLFWLFGGK